MAVTFNRGKMGGDQAPSVRPQLNVHPIFDAITGSYLDGVNGEKILNGGLWNLVAIVGEGNVGKSTIMNDILLRILSHHPSAQFTTFDTEANFQATRMQGLAQKYPSIKDMDFFTGEDRYRLQSIVEQDGEEWVASLKEFGINKTKEKNSKGTTPFLDKAFSDDKKKVPVKFLYPDLYAVDSLTEFQTGELRKKAEKHDIDDKEMNNFAMSDGLQKTRLLQEWKAFLPRTAQFLIFTGHVGEVINMGVTPLRKKLNYMRQGSKAKGIPQKTEFLTQHYWDIISAKPMVNSDRTDVFYPTKEDRGNDAKTDLLKVTFQGLRNKSGPSGIPVSLIVSQSKGVQWGLSCYDALVEKQWGMEEGRKFYWNYVFYPGKEYNRTTVRDEINADPLFERALEFGMEIMLMVRMRSEFPVEYRMKLSEIYTAVIERGYDWQKILKTRGYWLYQEEVDENTPVYLSGLDLIRIAKGEYDVPALKA